MTRQERLSRLVEFVVEHGSVHVDQIFAALGISAATARRDLDTLADQQLIIRTRGGALANATTSEVPLRSRRAKQWREKSAIAARAAALVRPGEIVGFNGGTTTTATAYELGVRVAADPAFSAEPITVVTNAVNIANDLTLRPQVRVVVTGGVARARSYELVGPLASAILPSRTRRRSAPRWWQLGEVDTLITDSQLDAATSGLLDDLGLEVIVV